MAEQKNTGAIEEFCDQTSAKNKKVAVWSYHCGVQWAHPVQVSEHSLRARAAGWSRSKNTRKYNKHGEGKQLEGCFLPQIHASELTWDMRCSRIMLIGHARRPFDVIKILADSWYAGWKGLVVSYFCILEDGLRIWHCKKKTNSREAGSWFKKIQQYKSHLHSAFKMQKSKGFRHTGAETEKNIHTIMHMPSITPSLHPL